MIGRFFLTLFGLLLVIYYPANAQLSPGPLASSHSDLEGISNCTQCHTLGAKVANEKCLACHTDLKSRIDNKMGYHSSSEISGKECISCHSDHHGLNFDMVRFDKQKFNHKLTGYDLQGAHSRQDCKACHKVEFIVNEKIKNNSNTYLGLNTDCASCHKDYHQQTLSQSCANCHGYESFAPAQKFNHASAEFKLNGKHAGVACIKCHVITTKAGVKFQVFKGIEFSRCTDCHSDPHKNQFGTNCTECHSVQSFQSVKQLNNFDHSKTSFMLEDRHLEVSCKSCHKTRYTDPIKYERCTDCHSDYHQNQFITAGAPTDCSQCHDTKGFEQSSFTVEDHNNGSFKLSGAHMAIPCDACHKTGENWNFRIQEFNCKDCHENIHDRYLDDKYYPDFNCKSCHSMDSWNEITFDHNTTKFPLSGAHESQTCRSCHFRKNDAGDINQQFANLSTACSTCHNDIHNKQFDINESTDCSQCHSFINWSINDFNHNATAFKLDGKHENVSCEKCHKYITEGQDSFILYKIKDTRCESCHL